MNTHKKTMFLLSMMFAISGSGEAVDYLVAENNSYLTTCAEEDNINVSHRSYLDKILDFEIKATHPHYINSIVSDNCNPDFSGCSGPSLSTSASLRTANLSCQKIHDDGMNVFSLCTELNWWRPNLMTVRVDGKSYSVANYDLYMTQAKLLFVIINHKVMIKHAIECIVLN